MRPWMIVPAFIVALFVIALLAFDYSLIRQAFAPPHKIVTLRNPGE